MNSIYNLASLSIFINLASLVFYIIIWLVTSYDIQYHNSFGWGIYEEEEGEST